MARGARQMMESTKESIHALTREHLERQEKAFVPGESFINIGWPCYGPEEILSAIDSLLDLRISQGKKVKTFEEDYAAYVGTKHGVAVNSGSSANLIAIAALLETGKVKPGSEVIVPAATFTTVISPIIQNGLIPVFVDVDERTYNIDPERIEAAITANTGLLMPVHSLGCPADMKRIMEIAKKHGLPVLEDCCEAHSATIDGQMVGSFGDISTYSFFVAHNMTTGEGGMVMTSDDRMHYVLRSLREFGRMLDHDPAKPRFHYTDTHLKEYDEKYLFERMGYNVRMSDLHASLGIEQLKRLPLLNKRRIETVGFYNDRLRKYASYLQLPTAPKGMYHSYYGYPIMVKEDAPFSRTQLVRHLEAHRIETRAFMGGNLAVQPAYRDQRIRVVGDHKMTRHVQDRMFFIGCHPHICKEEREHIAGAFDAFFKRFG